MRHFLGRIEQIWVCPGCHEVIKISMPTTKISALTWHPMHPLDKRRGQYHVGSICLLGPCHYTQFRFYDLSGGWLDGVNVLCEQTRNRLQRISWPSYQDDFELSRDPRHATEFMPFCEILRYERDSSMVYTLRKEPGTIIEQPPRQEYYLSLIAYQASLTSLGWLILNVKVIFLNSAWIWKPKYGHWVGRYACQLLGYCGSQYRLVNQRLSITGDWRAV